MVCKTPFWQHQRQFGPHQMLQHGTGVLGSWIFFLPLDCRIALTRPCILIEVDQAIVSDLTTPAPESLLLENY